MSARFKGSAPRGARAMVVGSDVPSAATCFLSEKDSRDAVVLQKVPTLYALRAPGLDKRPSDLVILAGRKGAYADSRPVGGTKS